MCTVCGLLEVREDPSAVKSSGSIAKTLVAERGYAEDNTNRRNALAHSYTPEGRQMQSDAVSFSYSGEGRDTGYVAPIFSLYSSIGTNQVSQQYSPSEEPSNNRQDLSGLESLAA